MYNFGGDPKTKFLRLLFSAVRRPPIRPTIKNFTWHCPCLSSDVRPGANPIRWGQSYTDVYTLGQIKNSSSGGPSGGALRGPHQEVGGQMAEGGRRRAKADGGQT